MFMLMLYHVRASFCKYIIFDTRNMEKIQPTWLNCVPTEAVYLNRFQGKSFVLHRNAHYRRTRTNSSSPCVVALFVRDNIYWIFALPTTLKDIEIVYRF